MSEDFVSREEFNGLKQEVQELKIEFNESKNILTMIDKKIDVITERLENTTKVSDLQNENIETRITSKLEPLKKDIEKNKEEIDEIKDNRKWLWRTIGAVIITGIVGAIITFQNNDETFEYEDVCELTALSNNSINRIVNLYLENKEV